MKYRLGLDVGTASVGLVALELDEKNCPVKPVWQSVRIFNEPLLPAKQGGIGEPKKAARRLARQQRRLHERRAHRLKRIAQLARLMRLDPETISADEGRHIHKLRSRAAASKISLEDLLRVFLKMSKRRGYSGGFKIKKGKDAGQVETGINELKRVMNEHDCGTLGEYLWWRIQHNQHLRLKEDGLFAERQMVEDEFNRIWETQEKHHPILKDDGNGSSMREQFYQAIFKQLPLASPSAMVGNCSLEPMLPRASMAQPVMQAFRIEKQIADLRWGTTRRAEDLTPEQRKVIREQLQSKKEVKFTDLDKALEKTGCPGPEGRKLNLSHGERESLTGDRTACAMKSLKLLDKWQQLAEGHRISVINLLADMGSPDVFDIPEWNKQLKGPKGAQCKIKPEVKNFIDQMVNTGKFNRLTKMGFDGSRAAYSVKALRKLVKVMREHGVDEHQAIALAYPEVHKANHEWLGKERAISQELPHHAPTGNTVVDVALRQVRYAINAAIAQLGTSPTEIIIELSRDMAVGLTKRGEIIKKMRENEKRRKWAANKIFECTQTAATPSQIRRYLLWQEQGEKDCPYCDRLINCSDAINGNETEYEHILPKSLTRIGKKRDFLVLAHKACNQQKEKKTPWQAWGHDPERWRLIKRRAKQFEEGYKVTVAGGEKTFKHKPKARQLLIKDFETEPLDDAGIKDFTERQFQETAWIAKACGKWLRHICHNVYVSRGRLTAHLRRTWGLDTTIPEVRYEEEMPVFDEDYQPNTKESDQEACKISKEDFDKYRPFWEGQSVSSDNRTHRRLSKRIDHRHHLVDALVIVLTTPGLYQRMAGRYKKITDSSEKNLPLYAEPELKDIRLHALELVRKCRPSHRPDRWLAGNMFKEKPSAVREINGERFYVQRKKLSGLAQKDLEKIVPESIRTIIQQMFEQRLGQGNTPEQALKEPILHPHWNTPIKRVCLLGTNARDAVRVEHGDRTSGLYKYLEPEGYAYLEFDSGNPDDHPRLIRLHDVLKPKSAWSVLPGIIRLHKGDTVRFDDAESYYVVCQIKAKRLILSPVTEAVADVGKVNSPRKREVRINQTRKLILVRDGSQSNSAC